MQLNEGKKKKDKKQATVLVNTPQPQAQPQLIPAMQGAPQPPYPQPQGWRGGGQGGRGQRGYNPGFQQPLGPCYTCGQNGHLARTCFKGAYGGGRGTYRGGYSAQRYAPKGQTQGLRQQPPHRPVNPYRGPVPGF